MDRDKLQGLPPVINNDTYEVKARSTSMSNQRIAPEYDVPVTEQPDIQKFFINVMYDAQFVVDGALAVRLCGAFGDVFKDKEWVGNQQEIQADFLEVHTYWMDRIVQFMYHNRYDVFPIACPNLKTSMSGFILLQEALDELKGFSELQLHAGMYMQAGILRAPQVQTFALRSILSLLTRFLPIVDFVTTVKWIFGLEVGEVPGLLKLAFATYTAHMEEEWALADDGAQCGELYKIPVFARMMWDARRNVLQKARRDGSQITGYTGMTQALMAYQPEESQVNLKKPGKFGYIPNVYEQ